MKRLLYAFLICTASFTAAVAAEPEPHVYASTPDEERFRLKAGVFLVLIEDEQVLLLRRFNTGIGDGTYVVPMGGLDEGETATEAVIREAREEANLILTPEDIEVVHVMHGNHTFPDGQAFEQMNFFFQAHHYEGEIKNMEPHKADDLAFFPIDALPEATSDFIRFALDEIAQGHPYSEYGWE
jgi:8-oxo-dGTP diphosphatase